MNWQSVLKKLEPGLKYKNDESLSITESLKRGIGLTDEATLSKISNGLSFPFHEPSARRALGITYDSLLSGFIYVIDLFVVEATAVTVTIGIISEGHVLIRTFEVVRDV